MLRIALFSESDFTVAGHGVHSAFIDNIRQIDAADDILRVSPWGLSPTDVLHSHSVGPIALALMHRHSGPRVVTAHVTPASLVGSLSCAEEFESFTDLYMRHFLSQADLILAPSAGAAFELRAMDIKRPVRIMPNTVDCSTILETRRRRDAIRLGLGWRDRPVILSVGQIQPRKGVTEFIECAMLLPEADFIWIGSFLFGPLSSERARLKRAICSAPPNVTFTGTLPRRRVYEYYAAGDIFFHPSHHETFGLAILEAAAAGLPILVRDLPAYRDVFGDGYIAADNDFASTLDMLIRRHDCRRDLAMKAMRVARIYDRHRLLDSLRDAYFYATELRGS